MFLRLLVCDVIKFRDDHARMRINDPLASFTRASQSRFQSFVPLDQRSENESSGSIHFQITMEITEFCISIDTIDCIYVIYSACLKWMLPELSFTDRWSRGMKSWERVCVQVREESCVVHVLPLSIKDDVSLGRNIRTWKEFVNYGRLANEQ